MPIPRVSQWLATLQSSGYRLTGPRYFVAQILAQSDRALSPQEVFELARQQYPTLGLSVYRTVEKLEALGLIQRVHQPDKCQAYIAAFEGHEHILVCRACGLVQFFQGDDLITLVQHVELDSGFQVDEHWLQFLGLCKECQLKSNDADPHLLSIPDGG
jgi:Fur family ferric uptake transcriptional regulator